MLQWYVARAPGVTHSPCTLCLGIDRFILELLKVTCIQRQDWQPGIGCNGTWRRYGSSCEGKCSPGGLSLPKCLLQVARISGVLPLVVICCIIRPITEGSGDRAFMVSSDERMLPRSHAWVGFQKPREPTCKRPCLVDGPAVIQTTTREPRP